MPLADTNGYMIANKLHINVGKSCYIHFKPDLSRGTVTCARVRPYDINQTIRLEGKSCKNYTVQNFLGR